MTPYDLEETKRRADIAVFEGKPLDIQIFNMLRALLQHEADKEAERCLARHHAEQPCPKCQRTKRDFDCAEDECPMAARA